MHDGHGFFLAQGDGNDIPNRFERRGSGTFWGFMAPLLALPDSVPEGDGSNAAIRQIRAWEALRTPRAPTVGELVTEVVEHVAEAVTTKVDAAKAWLVQRLSSGPVEATVIESEGKDRGWNLKLLKVAKSRLRIGSVRRRGKWLWSLPIAQASKGGDRPPPALKRE